MEGLRVNLDNTVWWSFEIHEPRENATPAKIAVTAQFKLLDVSDTSDEDKTWAQMVTENTVGFEPIPALESGEETLIEYSAGVLQDLMRVPYVSAAFILAWQQANGMHWQKNLDRGSDGSSAQTGTAAPATAHNARQIEAHETTAKTAPSPH